MSKQRSTCRSNIQLSSIQQCCFDIVAGVDGVLDRRTDGRQTETLRFPLDTASVKKRGIRCCQRCTEDGRERSEAAGSVDTRSRAGTASDESRQQQRRVVGGRRTVAGRLRLAGRQRRLT